jgi:hypothetical protein
LTLKEIFAYTRRRHGVGDRRKGVDRGRQGGLTDRRTGGADRRGPARAIGFGLICLGLAAPVRAQIYTSRDANGHLVLSNRSLASTARTYEVPQADSVRATRPIGEPSRSRLYDDVISESARQNTIRPDLVRAVVQVESGFNPWARSPKGALGLMQLMPATALQFGVKNAFNPVENVRAGVAYLRQLMDRYDNHEELALAAYNAGPGAVDKYGQSVPPYRETRSYVTRISSMSPRPVPVPMRRLVIYKTTETVDGHAVPRYSDHEPAAGSYEVVGRQAFAGHQAFD